MKSGKKYWSDWTSVAGQQFEYSLDDIGNRVETRSGGDENGWNLRAASYRVNNLNQCTSRTVPGFAEILGVTITSNTVTANGQTAYRRGEYFRGELSVNNGSAPVWQSVAVQTNGVTGVSGNVFVPKTPEVFWYDADGNLTNDGRWVYTWDAENRLVKVESVGTSPAASKRKVEWVYDPRGRRIQQTTYDLSSGSAVATENLKFVYDGWKCLAELNATNNALVRHYAWGLDLSGTMDEAGLPRQSTATAGGVGGLLWVLSGPAVYFCQYDGNGNVVGLVQGNGAQVAVYEYDPFGRTIRATGAQAKNNPFRFSTKRANDTTDFVLYEYRLYDPSAGRWPNRDPIEEEGGLNLYGFVRNNPIDTVDLFGLSDEKGAERLMKMCKPKPECQENEKVSIWICKRKLLGPDGPYPKIGPLSHSFIVCEDPSQNPDTTEKYGKQPRAGGQDGGSFYGPGYIVREPFNDFRDCREKKVCPKDKERMCKEGPTDSFYFLPSPWHNCHAWANGRCK